MVKLRSLLIAIASLTLALTTAVAAQDYPPSGADLGFVPRAASRHRRPHHRHAVDRAAGQAVCRGESHRRRRHHRRRIAGERSKDGHTLLIVSLAIAVNPWFYKMPYDPVKDSHGRHPRHRAERSCHQSEPPGQFGQGTDRAGQGETGGPKYASAGIGRSCTWAPSCSSSWRRRYLARTVPRRRPALIDVAGVTPS